MKSSLPTDLINGPEHYTAGGMEVIDILRAKLPPEQLEGHLRGCIIKYLFRYDKKGTPLQDLGKAIVYLRWLYNHIDPRRKDL
jgi:hypothetical protein